MADPDLTQKWEEVSNSNLADPDEGHTSLEIRNQRQAGIDRLTKVSEELFQYSREHASKYVNLYKDKWDFTKTLIPEDGRFADAEEMHQRRRQIINMVDILRQWTFR